jgi:CheY-like chemotaxis protein
VVDENPLTRFIVTNFLHSWECVYHEAETGKQAIGILMDAQKAGKPCQIVITEMALPDMTGEALGKAIKNHEKLCHCFLIMLTAIGQRGDAARISSLGFSGFLSKPVKKNHLFECLKTVMTESGNGNKTAEKQLVTQYTIEEKKIHDATHDISLNILLVEDNTINQKVAKIMLKKLGHTVEIADNGKEAVEAFMRQSFDLILMDIQMPVMNGIEATEKIREQEAKKNDARSRTPIIALTANALKGDRKRFLAAGMDDYISKPIKKMIFSNVIAKYISPQAADSRMRQP